MATWETLRELASALPEVQHSTSYGTPACKVRGKVFARLLEDGQRAAIFTHEREGLVAADPVTFTVPDHYVNYPMVVVNLSTVDNQELGELLAESWRLRAPKRLATTRHW
ncbi:MmcQ/YjbR family DNA-binding protein [Micromonospora sonneratiae]|uniref:MmcQ/YjbR family DNA-binding protein n=1 Tax=Micromonospora sonneratiae TaxID=1184706 RepID=A0ABW3YF17_9ACTN